jgi:hypothetical protein
MTSQRSQIFRAFARGESVARIAERRGVGHGRAWSQIRCAIGELDLKGGTALDTVRWQQYLVLMRIVDQAFAAFERSAEDGVKKTASLTVEHTDEGASLN